MLISCFVAAARPVGWLLAVLGSTLYLVHSCSWDLETVFIDRALQTEYAPRQVTNGMAPSRPFKWASQQHEGIRLNQSSSVLVLLEQTLRAPRLTAEHSSDERVISDGLAACCRVVVLAAATVGKALPWPKLGTPAPTLARRTGFCGFHGSTITPCI